MLPTTFGWLSFLVDHLVPNLSLLPRKSIQFQAIMNSQTLSGILQPELTFEQFQELLEQDEHRFQEPLGGRTAERDELFWLLNDSQEAYEASRLTALNLNPHATGSTTDTVRNSDQPKRNARFTPLHYSPFDFETSFAEPSAGWSNIALNPAQNTTNPQADLIDNIDYSDFLNMDFIERGSIYATAFAENINPSWSSTPGDVPYYHYHDGGEVTQFTNLQTAAQFTFNDDDRSGTPFMKPYGAISISDAHNERALGEGVHEGSAVSHINLGSVTGPGLKSLPSNEPAVPHNQGAPGVQRPFLLGSQFNFDFNFDFVLQAQGKDEVESDGVGTKLNKNVAQDAGRNNSRDDKENKETEPNPSCAVSHNNSVANTALESSQEANISTLTEEQPEKHKAHVEINTAVPEIKNDIPKPLKELPADIEISKPLESSDVATPEKKHSVKRKASNATEVLSPYKSGKILNIYKEKQHPRKKVSITKDQAIAGKRSGILTCNICIASTVKNSVYTFNRQADLNCHIQVVHEKTKQLTCPNAACFDKMFSKLSSLKRHKLRFGH